MELSQTTMKQMAAGFPIGRLHGGLGAGNLWSSGAVTAMEQSRLTNGGNESRKTYLAKLALVLTRWFQKWGDAFPSHEVTKLQMGTYLEALDDLTPDELDIGCREATRTAEQFPKPGHIRSALYTCFHGAQRLERPAYLDEPPTSAEDRAAGEEFSRALKKTLAKKDTEMNSSPTWPVHSSTNIDKQLAEYQTWLEAQAAKEAADRKAGFSPDWSPRTEVERLAIYLSLPWSERRRIAKSGEWIKLDIRNT